MQKSPHCTRSVINSCWRWGAWWGATLLLRRSIKSRRSHIPPSVEWVSLTPLLPFTTPATSLSPSQICPTKWTSVRNCSCRCSWIKPIPASTCSLIPVWSHPTKTSASTPMTSYTRGTTHTHLHTQGHYHPPNLYKKSSSFMRYYYYINKFLT